MLMGEGPETTSRNIIARPHGLLRQYDISNMKAGGRYTAELIARQQWTAETKNITRKQNS